MTDADQGNQRLQVTRQMLTDEFDNIRHAQTGVSKISHHFASTNSTYTTYGDKMQRTERLIKQIQRAEYIEYWKLMGSFYTFMGSAAYIFLKRFYLNEIIVFTVTALLTTVDWTVIPLLTAVQRLLSIDFMNYYSDVELV